MEAKSDSSFSAEEKAAMKATVAEKQRTKGLAGAKRREVEKQACIDRIAAMEPADRELAEAVHRIVTTVAPHLDPKTWYGMPAYARDGKVVVFFKDAAKFGSRYATLGFEEAANLDDGPMWVTSFALTALTSEVEQRISGLVHRAA